MRIEDKARISAAFAEVEQLVVSNQDWKNKYQKRLEALKRDYLQVMSLYVPICEKYAREWDALCLKKDKVYLDIHAEQFDRAYQTTRQILVQYPENRETLLLHALALTMMGMNAMAKDGQGFTPLLFLDSAAPLSLPEGWGSAECLANAKKTLRKYAELYPDYSAPALVLRGLIDFCLGNDQNGLAWLGQASIEYPRQASQLSEMLDLYRTRAYLRQSTEGNYLLMLYRSTMEGYGIFSPNLIKAGYYAQHDDISSSKREMFNHFFRRGNQDNYDCLLSDVQFCDKFLNGVFRQMVPFNSFMDLEVSQNLFAKNKLKVSIQNRSSCNLHNVRMFVCLHLTDMYTDEYKVVKFATRNLVPANQKTDFKTAELDLDGKSCEDIVHVRAIMMTDDAVCWLDEAKNKQERNLKQSQFLEKHPRSPEQLAQSLQVASFTEDGLKTELMGQVKPILYLQSRAKSLMRKMGQQLSGAIAFSPENKWKQAEGKLRLEMPASLLKLSPAFSLTLPTGEILWPEVEIANDRVIRLLFDMEPKECETYMLSVHNRDIYCSLELERAGDEVKISKVEIR